MSDIETRARRAGAAARDEARARLERLDEPAFARAGGSRGRRMLVAACAAAVLLVVVSVLLDVTPVPTIDPVTPPDAWPDPVAEEAMLPVPDVGEVLAAYLEDGRPVFVSHAVEGDVVVLDGVVPGAGPRMAHLNAFCPSSGWFEDPWYASRFNRWGDYTAGPSPTAMPAYPSELSADGSAVRVIGPVEPAPQRGETRGQQQPPEGPACVEEDGGTGEGMVLHRPPDPLPELDSDQIPTDRWVWASLVVGGETGRPVVCDADGTCPPGAPAVADVEEDRDGTLRDRTPTPYLARATEQGTVRLLAPADRTLSGWAAWPPEQRLFAMPEPGQAAPAYLVDNTPLFVVHTRDGNVHVLDPTPPEQPIMLVGWCEADRTFASADGSQFAPDGSPQAGPATQGLSAYPHQVIEVGETHGVAVTGSPTPSTASAPEQPPATSSCDRQDLVAHAPADQEHVYEQGVHLSGERWTWVRMRIERVDGELYLCTGSDQPCGQLGDPDIGALCEPSDTPDDPDDPDSLACRPYRDPVVTTLGASPTTAPQLLLVHAHDNGRTVDVRQPVAASQP